MTLVWYLFYGRQLGMSRREILACPIGEMQDMIACMQIVNGATPQTYAELDDLEKVR